LQPPLADDTSGRLIASAKDSIDFVVVAANGAIRERKICFFARQISIHHQKQIFRPGGDARLKYAIEHWPDSRPDLFPALTT
jgi:hypothetical protein